MQRDFQNMKSWAAPDDPLGAFCRENHIELEGSRNGPLAGTRFAVKDAFHIAGARTGFGQPDWLRTHDAPRETAAAVKKLLAVGADMVGKTHCDELCYSLTGENVHYGTPVNVNAPGRVPGGSSNGSAAAVAGGLVDFARSVTVRRSGECLARGRPSAAAGTIADRRGRLGAGGAAGRRGSQAGRRKNKGCREQDRERSGQPGRTGRLVRGVPHAAGRGNLGDA